jgi:hypothetical protein
MFVAATVLTPLIAIFGVVVSDSVKVAVTVAVAPCL